MGQIYSPPKEIEVPDTLFMEWKEQEAAEKKFIEELTAWVKQRSTDKYAGEILSLQIADGYAQYMIISLRPVKMIHLPLCDEYQYPYVHRLTAKDIKGMLEADKKMAALFNKEVS